MAMESNRMLRIHRLSGEEVTIASEDLDDAATVWQLKVRCHAEVHVSVYRQRLVQEGAVLKNDQLLTDLAEDFQLLVMPLETPSQKQIGNFLLYAERGDAASVESYLKRPFPPDEVLPPAQALPSCIWHHKAVTLMCCNGCWLPQQHLIWKICKVDPLFGLHHNVAMEKLCHWWIGGLVGLGHWMLVKESVRALLSAKANMDAKSKSGRSPLWIACSEGHLEVARQLVEANANVNFSNVDGLSPLHICAELGRSRLSRLLCEASGDVDLMDVGGQSPLWIASHFWDNRAVGNLHWTGTVVEDHLGRSPLWIACHEGQLDVARKLLGAKASVNVVDLDGRTPLRICAELGHSQIAELLLNDANADVNLVDGSGRSPLWMAACYGRLKVMMALVAAQADVQKVTNAGRSALWIAAGTGHAAAVQFLLQLSADKEKTDDTGASPLWIACSRNHAEVVRLLVQAGADQNVTDHQGRSARSIAFKPGKLEVLHALRGTNPRTPERVPLSNRWHHSLLQGGAH
eukprot:symbB.v1.2.002222.t1/scaffold119.1/size318073/20